MEVYLGTICAFGFNFFPINWAYCNGQSLSIASYRTLFSLLGTNYGGDGTSTFNLPDLRGVAAVGIGQGESFYKIGQTGGSNSVMLNSDHVPPHSHAVTMGLACKNADADVITPSNTYPANPANGNLYIGSRDAATIVAMKGTSKITIGQSTPASLPIDITDPYLPLNYCICLSGEFPHRSEQ